MSKIKRFFRQTGLTKAQLISSLLCYFLCFALFLGIVVIWNPHNKTAEAAIPTAPTINADENWTDHRATGFRSGSGTSSDPYLIASADELAYLAYSVNNGTSYSGSYFRQIDDIDLSAYTWVAIGDVSNPFSGNYDGGNYLIEGMFSDGLFEYITYSTGRQVIENIILKNCVSYWGICHNAYGAPSDTAKTLYFRNCVVDITMNFNSLTTINVGAITCGSYDTVWFQYCVNYSDIAVYTTGGVAGIVGEASGPSYFINCVNLGNILNSENGSVGGIFGRCRDSTMNMIIGCVNRGSIEGHRYTGGIGGYLYGPSLVYSNTNAGPVSGGSYVGGIVGSANAAVVANCSNFGEISAYDSYVGGLFGTLWFSGVGGGTSLAQSFNRGNIVASGADWVGGLVGQAFGDDGESSITDCYNVGEVEGSGGYYGGIVGELLSTSGNFTITRTFNNENITGGTDVGGLVGNVNIYNSGSASISACFSGNCATSGNSNEGPIFGRASGSPLSVTHVYYFEDLSSAYGTRETREFADTISSSSWYSSIGWDMTNWSFDADGSVTLPRLVLFLSDVIYDTSWYTASGGASSSSPYLISDFRDILGMVYLNVEEGLDFSGKYFRQTADIDFRFIDENTMSSTGGMGNLAVILAAGYQFVGIGQRRLSLSAANTVASTGEVFAGNYDGNGYSILGVISYGNYYEQGIFGYVLGTVQNLVVKESYIFGRSYVGGIAGYASGTISSCANQAYVAGSSDAGGIAGYSSGTISSCANQAYVAGSSDVGGIAGCASGTVTNCYNTGQVVGGSYVGGIAGYLGDNGSNINRCYNNGSVTGSSEVGGIVGRANSYVGLSSSSIYIENCFNLGYVRGSGIVGTPRFGAGVSNRYVYIRYCYNLGTVTGSQIVGASTGSGTRKNVVTTGSAYGTNKDLPKSVSWFTNSSNWNSSYPWDFTNTWTIDPSKNNSYPILRNAQAEQPIAYWTDFGNYSIEWYTSSDTVTYGDGSASNPYIIDSAEDLAGLSYLVYSGLGTNSGDNFFADKYFKQTVDIDLTGHYWQPIGISYDRLATQTIRAFAGNYDGGGHTVSSISTPAGSGNGYSYQGLFGYVRSSSSSSRITIQNVGVIDSHIQGSSYVGGVVGYAKNVDITNCFNTASVNASQYAAGIVGRVMDSDISINKCYNTGRVTAENYIGGILGEYQLQEDASGTALIQNCYNTGNVSAEGESNNNVGGIAGRVATNSATISGDILVVNCYNRGTISGGTRIAGIVGESYSLNPNIVVDIINCFNVGTIANTGDYGSETVCCNGGSQPFVSGFQYKSAAESGAKTIEFFTNFANWNATDLSRTWNFRTVWKFDPSVSEYPVFRAEGEVSWWTDEGNYSIEWFTSAGTNGGSASNPYIIDSAEDLAGLSWLVYTGDSRAPKETAYVFDDNYNSFFYNKHFKLASDINLAAHIWQPIGIMNDSANNCFGGIFDGNGHTIKGVFTLEENGSMQSLFGTTYSPDESYPSSIQNLMVTNSVIKGTSWVGGILGYAFFNSQIINCKFSGEIYGSAGSIGGIVGEITDCLISGCVNNGTVTNAASAGSDYNPIGGIVGYANTASTGAKIEYSANYGKVIGKNTAGGIVGHNMSAEIYYCTNNGDVSSSDSSGNGSVGGIVGRIKSTAKISLSQNNGKISGYNYVGGIIGVSESNIDTESNIGTLEIYSCINNGAITGTGGSIGGIAGQICMTNLKLCINYGDVTALNNFGGIVGQLIGQGAIEYCYAEFKLTQTKEHCAGGGIVGLINHNSATGPDAFEITNCYVDVTMSLITSDEVGAILGADYSKGTYQPVVIEKCAAFVNGKNVAARLLGGARAGSKLTFNLCYGVFNGSSKIIEGENFDGNFAYIQGFHEGRPIPLGIFHILDFGTKTGIKTRVNAL